MDTASRLLLFLDVVEQGSFARVAELRDIDRSAVSKQISRLEEELGVRLLNRSTRSFSLTAAGAEMVKKARQLRVLLGDTLRLAENYHLEPRGLLKITCPAIFGRHYVQPAVIEFQQRFPQVEIELRLEDRIVDLVAEGYDLAFRIGEPKDSSLIARRIARNRMAILASPGFLKRFGEPQSVEELAKLPAAIYSAGHMRADTINFVDEDARPQQLAMKGTFMANDADLLKLAALSDSAYVVIPAFALDDEVVKGELIPIMTALRLPDYSAVYGVYPHRDLPVRTRLFFEAMREHIGQETPIWEHRLPGFENMYGFADRQLWQKGR